VIHVASGEQPVSATSKTPIDGYPTLIGDDVTVGHMTLLHACTIGSNAFVGMKAVVMDGAKVESWAMLAAGALLTAGKTIKSGQLWAGSPAKFWRELTDADRAQFPLRSGQYVALGQDYRKA
jgi:gamma-carbonic anhydrase